MLIIYSFLRIVKNFPCPLKKVRNQHYSSSSEAKTKENLSVKNQVQVHYNCSQHQLNTRDTQDAIDRARC